MLKGNTHDDWLREQLVEQDDLRAGMANSVSGTRAQTSAFSISVLPVLLSYVSDEEVLWCSIIKRSSFQMSRFKRGAQTGHLFD